MSKIHQHPLFMLSVGVVLGCAVMTLKSPPSLKAATSHGNDKFSMCTVNVTLGESEAVFALDHLTGVLSGGCLNNQTGTFTHKFLRNIAADFQVNPATPEPKYAIVSGSAQMRASGGVQPANGILYVGELTSGAVVAYGFAMPRGRGAAAPLEIFRLDAFPFREAIGG